jgi:DNA-binding transcriptional LysR family regulator
MELRHLRYFIAVAEELSFTRAAERVHITQPPLSRAIADLEAEVETRLIDRTTQSVSLTDAGLLFLDHARVAVQSADAAKEAARSVGKGQAGRLKIGFVGAAAYSFFPQVLRRYREDFPLVALDLTTMTIDSQLSALRLGEIDVGLLRPPFSESEVSSSILFKETFVVALPDNHRLCAKASISLKDLSDESFIVFPRGEGLGFHAEVLALCRRSRFVPRVAQEATPMQTLIGLVDAGMGVAIVPSSAMALHLPRVVYRPIQETYAATTFSVAWKKGNRSPIVQRFVETATAVVKDMRRARQLKVENMPLAAT